jgi:hypothetical protein
MCILYLMSLCCHMLPRRLDRFWVSEHWSKSNKLLRGHRIYDIRTGTDAPTSPITSPRVR